MFRAVRTKKVDEKFITSLETMDLADLPQGELLVEVHYSSINYKDALSSIGNPGVTKAYPHTPGIDASGIVVESTSKDYKKGDEVIITGYDFGMNTHGGFSEYIRVPAQWAQPLPENMTLREAMLLGTAGFTAAMSVNEILPYIEGGKILVTGASGGVGSIAVKILKHLDYQVVSPLRREKSRVLLEEIGVDELVDFEEIEKQAKRALASTLYDGAIDTTGGVNLHYALISTAYGGAVSACGNAGSAKLETTVFPFILRGVRLIGIDSVLAPEELRRKLWKKLAGSWKSPLLEVGVTEICLDQVPQALEAILEGQHQGRYLIKVKN